MSPPWIRCLRRAAALSLVPVLAVLVACSRTPSDGRIHITHWEKWTGGEGAAIQEVVDAFNASQDRIHVTLVAMAQIDRKLITATAGGTPPDLAGI